MKNIPLCGGKYYFGEGAGTAIKNSLKDAKRSIKIISPYVTPSLFEILTQKASQDVSVSVVMQHFTKDPEGYNAKSEREFVEQSIIHSSVCEEKSFTEQYATTKTVRDVKAEQEYQDILRLRWFHLFWVVAGLFLVYYIIIWPSSSPHVESVSTLKFLLSMSTLFTSIFLSVHFIDAARKRASKLSLVRTETILSSAPKSKKTIRYDYLKKENINLKLATHSLLHVKLFIIDDAVVYFGSVNFTYSAFHSNYELRAKITDPSEVSKFVEAFETIYNEMEHADFDEYCRTTFQHKIP